MSVFFYFMHCLPGISGDVVAGEDGSLSVTHWISLNSTSLFGLCVGFTCSSTSETDEVVGPSTAGLEASLVGGRSSSTSMSTSKGWHQLSVQKCYQKDSIWPSRSKDLFDICIDRLWVFASMVMLTDWPLDDKPGSPGDLAGDLVTVVAAELPSERWSEVKSDGRFVVSWDRRTLTP